MRSISILWSFINNLTSSIDKYLTQCSKFAFNQFTMVVRWLEPSKKNTLRYRMQRQNLWISKTYFKFIYSTNQRYISPFERTIFYFSNSVYINIIIVINKYLQINNTEYTYINFIRHLNFIYICWCCNVNPRLFYHITEWICPY